MRTLLAFELKKILHRKVLWVALALGVVMWAQVRGVYIIRDGFSGYSQGMKDFIAQYEGQVLTDALQARIQQDYESYVAARADRFAPEPMPEGEPASGRLAPTEPWGYDAGIWHAFGQLTAGLSLEKLQERLHQDRQMLESGVDQQGKKLTPLYRQSLDQDIRRLSVTPVVHDAEAWKEFLQAPNENGLWVLVATVVALLGLFGGEASARMEAILLSARDRQRAVMAKLLAAAIVAGGSVALFFGLQFAALAYAWGLQGALLPAVVMDASYANMPIVAFFSLSVLVLILDAAACGAIVAWASARFRHALPTLLVAGAILAGMAELWRGNMALLQPMYEWFPSGSTFPDAIRSFVYALPVNTLMENGYRLADSMSQAGTMALALALPAGLVALLCWLAHRAFLRRRRT